MGLLDPEFFTTKIADYQAKEANLQYLTVPNTWPKWVEPAITTQKEQGVPEADLGYRIIPGAFPAILQEKVVPRYGTTNQLMVISKSCKNPETAMKLMDYLYSFEGIRLLTSGIEGVHWEEVNGQKEYTDETLQEMLSDPTGFMNRTGIYYFYNMFGIGEYSIDEDGQYLYLNFTEKTIEANLTEADKAFAEHYGVEYPAQVYETTSEIVAHDTLAFDMMAPLDSDMEMVSTQCDMYYATLMADLVNATSDEEFEEIWDRGCAELEGMGYFDLMETITNNLEVAKEELEGLSAE